MRILLSEEEIRKGVAQLARRIAAETTGDSLTVVGVLTGSLIFLADLVRQLDLPLEISMVQASSYRGQATSPGSLQLAGLADLEVAGRHVLLLDDIFDTGQTLEALLAGLRSQQPASLRSAVLLWKEGRQKVAVTPDYYCFKIPDVFVVGYGLDYNGAYRQLPHVAELEPQDQ